MSLSIGQTSGHFAKKYSVENTNVKRQQCTVSTASTNSYVSKLLTQIYVPTCAAVT